MTEGHDAGAAPVPRSAGGWPGAAAVGPSLPLPMPAPVPANTVPANTVPANTVPASAVPATAVPASNTVPASAPGALAGSAEPGGGTGWPGDAQPNSPAQPARSGAPGWPPPGPARGDDASLAGGAQPGTAVPGSGTAEARPGLGESARATVPDEQQRPAGPAVPVPGSLWTRSVDAPQASAGPAAAAEDEEPFARVDARKLEAALLGLRHPIVTVPLVFDSPGVSAARAERVKLLSQIDDYLLPRLRQSGAPILVALVGSTGAGKSTLLNSLVGKQVSATGIRRPTTNSPVLACHPDDTRWFAENVFLPTLPRVRQQGLAMPGRDGLLVLAASEGMPRGVAVLDTPDIDSVVQAHRDFAHQFLDASDLWLFVTTARRYADAAVWDMLRNARDRGAALAVALSRVPPPAAAELTTHFDAMLEANGLREVRRFVVPETTITDAQLPANVAAPIRGWLADTAKREDRRVAVLTQTMSGVLDTFRDRVPALADEVIEQNSISRQLREAVDSVYAACLAEFDAATGDGSLLHGEVLARWQDLASTGDLLRTLQVRRSWGGKQKKVRMPARAAAVKAAVQASMVSLVTATADRAAELVVADWQLRPAGAALLAEMGPTGARSADGTTRAEADFVATALADLGLVTDAGGVTDGLDRAALVRATARFTAAAARAVGSWQEQVVHLVREENVTKRSIARVVSFDEESLALVLTIGVLGYARADATVDGVAGAVPQQLLESLLGAGLLRDISVRVRADLRERVGQLLDLEARRFFVLLDSAGVPEVGAATELLQAGYELEAAR
jgi:energy-coupling factor transporter ATP-binding protein EcfA2